MNDDRVRRVIDAIGRGLRQFLVAVSWATLYLLVVLASMAALITVTTGWEPVVVTSGSMAPTLKPGDILFVDEHPDGLIGQQSVITYERDDGELVTHRVFATLTEQSAYVTKGDANPTPDVGIVEREDVRGVGWLVVPYLGLPAIWVIEGNVLALIALAVIAIFAIMMIVATSERGSPRADESDDRFSQTSQRGISRVRMVVAAMVTMLIAVNGQQFAFEALQLSSLQTLGITLAGLGSVSLLSLYRTARMVGRRARRFATIELVGDTLTIVFVVAASGTSSIGWILMALPIVEAAIHFRLTGAFLHWIVLSGLSIGALFFNQRALDIPKPIALDRLEQLVDRLGVLLLVVIPASYLAEQLLGDVLAQRRATQRAEHKTAIIERVTAAGREVARLDSDVFPTLVASALDLGFDVADCWTGDPESGWHRLAHAASGTSTRQDDEFRLPAPDGPGSGLRRADLAMGEVVIGVEDPDDDATNDVATCGLAAVIRITMAVHENLHVVLRAGSVELGGDPTSQAAALRLLTAQATVALQNGQLLDEVRKTHAEIAHQAKHDSLTDLANRGHFTEVLAATLERTDVDPHRTTVMFLDLNGFKAVNDRLGHNAGDALLRSVADRIGRAVGSRGMLARLGGDEFTILLVDDEPDAGDRLADQIHARLAVPFDVAGESVTVATSIGISQAEPGIGVSEMLRRSDVAMYSAKKPGKTTRTVRYHVGLDEEERRTEALGRSLAGAIANDELHLLYQPIVTTGDGAIVGTEALIRWDHPLLGPVSPPDILGVAESIDLIDELNAWIVRRAMIDMARCLPRTAVDGIEPFVAINLSPREVELTSLVDNLTAAMDESGLRPSQIVIELSERIAAESLDSIPNVDVLVERGMRLALDDFGQGHTSLAHLRKLPISCLKLDRALVLNADDSVEDRTILRSVVSLARDLGYSVIAEGVETDHQLSIVRSAGAQYVQGFGLHRPMRVGELQELLDRATWDPLGHPIDLAGERDDLDHPDHHDPDGHGSEGHGSDHLDDVPGELISVGATTTARNGANSISPGRPTPGAGGTQHNTQSPAVADLGVETQPRPAERNEADSSTGAQTTSTDPASRPAFGPTIQSSIRERPAVFPPPAPTARDAG